MLLYASLKQYICSHTSLNNQQILLLPSVTVKKTGEYFVFEYNILVSDS